ncbi:hypothetical protein ACJX0J_040222, partial [Zea mays]
NLCFSFLDSLSASSRIILSIIIGKSLSNRLLEGLNSERRALEVALSAILISSFASNLLLFLVPYVVFITFIKVKDVLHKASLMGSKEFIYSTNVVMFHTLPTKKGIMILFYTMLIGSFTDVIMAKIINMQQMGNKVPSTTYEAKEVICTIDIEYQNFCGWFSLDIKCQERPFLRETVQEREQVVYVLKKALDMVLKKVATHFGEGHKALYTSGGIQDKD